MQPKSHKTKFCFFAIISLLMVLLAQPAMAVTKQWVGPTNNNLWNNANNWSPVGVPVAGDDAFVTDGTQTVTYTNAANPLLNAVIVDSAAGTMTLTQTYYPTGNLSATAETIGLAGIGVYNQSAGSNTVGSVAGTAIPATTLNRTLVLGFRPGSSGTYNKTGGTLTAWNLMVGRAGTGIFNLSGNLTVNNDETIANNATGVGTFNQTYGIHTIGRDLYLGDAAGASGTFKMSSGILNVGRDEVIGNNGTGNFTMSSGTHTVGRELDVGNNTGGIGNFTMSSGILNVAKNMHIGSENATGTFTQTSGSVTVGGDLILARTGASTGNYTMTSGSLTVKGQEIIGNSGIGTFTHISGSHTIAKKLTIGTASGTGTYNMTSGSLTSNNSPLFDATADIQINAQGTFNVKTGTVTGDVDNLGLVKVGPDGDVTWNGNFVNHNAYVSDPSTQTFNNNLVNDATGYIDAQHNQDLFIVRGDFINDYTGDAKNTLWKTEQARLRFAAGGVPSNTVHDFYIAGADTGPPGDVTVQTIVDNFAWRQLNITNQTINLKDGSPGTPGGAQYVGLMTGAVLDTVNAEIDNIFGDLSVTLNIYYDPDLSGNSYLLGNTWNFAQGNGQLIPFHTPVPSSVLLMSTGLLGLGALGWRRRKRG